METIEQRAWHLIRVLDQISEEYVVGIRGEGSRTYYRRVVRDRIAAQMAISTINERERCRELAESLANRWARENNPPDGVQAARDIANAISQLGPLP